MTGYKPFLFDAFNRWCAANQQTPVLEFYTRNCVLPSSYQTHDPFNGLTSADHETVRPLRSSSQADLEDRRLCLTLSPQFCRYLELTEEGVQFWIIPKGQPDPFQVFIPVDSWIHMEAKESGLLQPLGFEEVMPAPELPAQPLKQPTLRLAASDGRLIK